MARVRGAGWRMIHPPSHLNYFSRPTMARLLDSVGFDVLPIRSVGTRRDLLNILHLLGLFSKRPLDVRRHARTRADRPDAVHRLLPQPARHHVRGGSKAGPNDAYRAPLCWGSPARARGARRLAVLGGRQFDAHVPLALDHEATFAIAQARTTIAQGRWWTNPDLGVLPADVRCCSRRPRTSITSLSGWSPSPARTPPTAVMHRGC